MALILECAHPLKRDRVTDVHVRCRDVDAELHPERPAKRELLLETALGKDVDGVTGELGDRHRPADHRSRAPGPRARIAASVLRRRRSTAAPPKPRRRIRKLRLLVLL